MTADQSDLTQAVVLYLGYGVAVVPVCSGAELIELHGQDKGLELTRKACELNDEATKIPIDWVVNTLEAAGQIVRVEMHHRYPHLGGQALDAIVWKFTYDWR